MSNAQTLSEYKQQLTSVEELLKTVADDQKADLLELKNKLHEVILLLKENDATNSKQNKEKVSADSTSSEQDDEFLRFQREINQIKGSSSSAPVNEESESDEEDVVHSELCKVLSSLEGNKCRAPFVQEWGEKGYHNAVVFSTDQDENEMEDLSNMKVQVMFCNPLCDQMKPCPFFLDGHCKFSSEKCRFSHGYSVNYSDLEEYVLPDYSNVQRDSRCLAKYKDGLWYSAVVEKCLKDNNYFVKYSNFGTTDTLEAQNILPLGSISLSDDSSSSSDDEDSIEPEIYTAQNSSSEINYVADVGTSAIGLWEAHTKGIGSKLMAKMGYVWGQGLGKHSDGRIEPIEAVVLPKGKSLDMCAEIKEAVGAVTVEDKFNAEKIKEQERTKQHEKYNSQETTVFDFLNKSISNSYDSHEAISRKRPFMEKMADADSNGSNSNLNFTVFAVGERIKKMKKEIFHSQKFLLRNATRNQSACEQMKRKMAEQKKILTQLEAKERSISQQINIRKDQKKIIKF